MKNKRIKKKEQIKKKECMKERIILLLHVSGRNMSRDSHKTKHFHGAVQFLYYLVFYTLHDR